MCHRLHEIHCNLNTRSAGRFREISMVILKKDVILEDNMTWKPSPVTDEVFLLVVFVVVEQTVELKKI